MDIFNDISEKLYSGSSVSALYLLDKKKDLRILDVGIGDGTIGKKLNGVSIVDGITISQLESDLQYNNYNFIYCGDFLNFESSEQYDYIILSHFLEHVIYPEKYLIMASKLLRKNGRIILSVPNLFFYKYRYQLFLGNWPYSENGIWDYTHVKIFTKAYFNKLFHISNLVVDQDFSRFIFFKNILHGFASEKKTKILKYFGGFFLFEYNYVLKVSK